ncbi:MAG: bifunctional lysylphosphatidylglycerol flippase/synthetase MprF [Gaiellaceae bacterium]
MPSRTRSRKLLQVERHLLGPRVYVLGVRLHEWHLGAGVLAALGVGALLGFVHDTWTTALVVLAGLWLFVKDIRDVVPKRRDTGAWRLGLHRPPLPLRTLRRADSLPRIAATLAVVVALVNLASALTPTWPHWRGRLLLQVEPLAALHIFHALAIPASALLLVTAYFLARRRARALQFAIGLLLFLVVVNVLKGLDIEEAFVTALAALMLWLGRSSFYVQHEPLTPGSSIWRVPLILIASACFAFVLVAVAAPAGASPSAILRGTGDLLLWMPAPLRFSDEFTRLDLAVGGLSVLALLSSAYIVFRPLAAPRALPDEEARSAAGAIVRAYGVDTLSYFKLRHDYQYLFSPDRQAFLGYRIEGGVLLVSGDPVGAAEAVPAVLRELGRFAERRGLRVAAIGVSETIRPLFAQLGLHALYLGDEAVVETRAFSLEGRSIRKVRQSVSRLVKAGYSVELVELSCASDELLAELEELSSRWRRGGAERGFSMALDAIRRDEQAETVLVCARDGGKALRGFIHFVPTYGRPAMSLSLMRRDRSSPNGLIEFLVVRSIELLRERGIEEVSLNFAVFARLLHSPRGLAEKLVRGVLRTADAAFQIERLYRFNAKFAPRWEPRYLMYESRLGLPRTGLVAMWIEGQIPKPHRRAPSGTLPSRIRPAPRADHDDPARIKKRGLREPH